MNSQNEIKSKTENYLKADLCVNFPSYPFIRNETGFSVNTDDSLCNFGSNNLVKDRDESEKTVVKIEPYEMQPDLIMQEKFSFPRKEIQKNRNQGKAYITKTGKIIEERKCIPLNPCRKNCKDKLTYEYQKLLFNTYWSLKSYNQRLMYISSLIEIVDKASQTLNKNLTNPRNRQNTVLYYIESNGTKINICKSCFICTFGETESFIRTVKMKKMSCNSNLLRDNRGKAVPRHKLSDEKYESIKNHIINFPPFEINNRKSLPSVKYSRSKLSISKMHQLYCQKYEAGTKALTNDKCYLPLAKLSPEENQQFIELYKSYRCLWDVNHIGFRFKTQRQEGLQGLLDVVNEQMNLTLSPDELQKKLYYIRYAFTQEKHRQIECKKLKTDFKPQCKLYSELLFLKDSVGPFKCEYCEQIFNGPDQYKIHKSSHDGSMPYTCPICKKGFMKVGNCTVHLRRHTKDYQFECKECGKQFPTSTDLNVHSRHHTGEKPYFCDICGQSFRTWTYFDSHRRRHEKNPNHKCTICFKGFYENNKLKQHMKSHLNVRDKVCNVCGKSFTCTKYLNQHKQTHSEKKKYSCKICGKHFAQYGGLSSHIKSHGTTITNILNDKDDDNIMEEISGK